MTTHSIELEISAEAFVEISGKLHDARYNGAPQDDLTLVLGGVTLDRGDRRYEFEMGVGEGLEIAMAEVAALIGVDHDGEMDLSGAIGTRLRELLETERRSKGLDAGAQVY